MLLSVVIPVYKVEIYLRKCLEKVLAQGFTDMEVILVDDGSPDNCGEICDGYAGSYPSIVQVIHQRNKGVGGARNAGLERACGRYIFFIDSDDTISEVALGAIADELRKYDYPDMLIFDGRLVDEQGHAIMERVSGVFPECRIPCGELLNLRQTKELLFEFPSACLRVTKREIYMDNDIRFPEGVWFEDNVTVLQLLACSSSIIYYNYPLYNYLQRLGSITRSSEASRRIGDIITVFETIFHWYESRGLLDEYRQLLVAKAVHEILVVQAVMAILAGGSRELLNKPVVFVEQLDGDYLSNEYIRRFDSKTRLKINLLAKRRFSTLSAIFKFTALLKRLRK